MQWIFLVVTYVLATLAAMAQPSYSGPFKIGTLDSRIVSEASGIACQPDTTSRLWLINDSGDRPQVYASTKQGAIQCTFRLKNAKNIDWEDLALAKSSTPGQYELFVADIGDNNAKRANVTIYRARTPHDSVISNGVYEDTAEAYTFTYPDGPRDAETFLIDPRTRDFYIISKRDKQARVYRAEAPHRHGTTRKLEFVTTLPVSMLTAGDVSHDGSKIILKNYLYAWHWERREGESIGDALKRPGVRIAYMPEEQGESICFTHNDGGYITTSERENGGANPPLYLYLMNDGERGGNLRRDAKLPDISIAPTPDKPGSMTLRYVVPEVARVSITVVNMILMTMQTVDEDSGEAGVQEREIDIRRLPPGDYAVFVKSNMFTVSVPFTK